MNPPAQNSIKTSSALIRRRAWRQHCRFASRSQRSRTAHRLAVELMDNKVGDRHREEERREERWAPRYPAASLRLVVQLHESVIAAGRVEANVEGRVVGLRPDAGDVRDARARAALERPLVPEAEATVLQVYHGVELLQYHRAKANRSLEHIRRTRVVRHGEAFVRQRRSVLLESLTIRP